jgi:glutamate-1-semialdehyde 2,1-aminomutase
MNTPYDFVVAPYNDIAAVDSIISSLPPDTLAAILIEPMQCAGGCYPATPEFLRHLREIASKLGSVLIFDEVMTSRLDYGGLQVTYGIKPDMTTIGKWAGGGMSFGAFGGRKEIMELFDPRQDKLTHSGTFNNNIMTMAAGLAGCQIMNAERLKALNTLGDKLKSDIQSTIDKKLSNSEGNKPKMLVRGLGSLLTIAFDGPEKGDLQTLLFHHLLDEGIYIASRGFMALTLEIKEEHCAQLINAIDGFIDRHEAILV